MEAKEFIRLGNQLIKEGHALIAYGQSLIDPSIPKKKGDHRTKAYMDNLKREMLLDHNEKIRKQQASNQ